MFRRFDRLVPLLNFKQDTLSLYGDIMSYSFFNKNISKSNLKIPPKEKWEIRDFKIKDVTKIVEKNKITGYTSINGYTYGIPYNEQWDIKDFILKK
tara:strand:+ start:204 stop:491 length:288 start_codon:yes stop_codon:yes gene_type:complete